MVLILLGDGLGFALTHFSVSFVLYPACLRVPQGMYILFFIVFLFIDHEKLYQDLILFLYFAVLSSVYVVIASFLIVLIFSSFCNRFCLTLFCVSFLLFSPRAGGFPTVCMPFFLLFFYILMPNRLIKTFPGGFLAGWSLSLLWLALVVLNFVLDLQSKVTQVKFYLPGFLALHKAGCFPVAILFRLFWVFKVKPLSSCSAVGSLVVRRGGFAPF